MSQATFNGPVSGHNFSSFTVNDGSVSVNNYGCGKPAVRSYIPYPRNEDIVLRPDITAVLESRLPLQNGAQSAALCGLGGSGKTQMALQYAYGRCSDQKTSVFWVHAENEATFSHDYKCIADVLGLNIGGLAEADMLQAVNIGIQKQSPWVLIVDNADNLGLFGVGDVTGSKTMRSYIPSGPGGTVLWTTRDEQILGTLVGTRRGIKVARMKDGEAKELLSLARGSDPVSSDDEQVIEALLKELHWLPLAVFQAGAYMRESLTHITEYLELLRQGQRRWEVLKESYNDRHRREGVTNSVLATWSISVQYIKQQNKLAYDILHIIAYLDNQKIQQEVLQEAGVVAANQEQPHDKVAIGRAIKRLSDFSFLTRRTDGESELSYEMHKLVQEGIRYQLSHAGETEERVAVVTALKERQNCPEEQGYFLSALMAVEKLFPDYGSDEVSLWGQCEKYLAHCIQMASFASRHGGETLGGRLFERAGLYAFDRGMFRQAEMLEGAALALLRKGLGEDKPDVLQLSVDLAVTYTRLGRDSEAEKLLLQVLQTGEQTLGGEDEVVLEAMSYLADLQNSKGLYSEAEKLTTQVHRIRHEKLGEMHPYTIRVAERVASNYRQQGHYAKAEEMQVRVVEHQRQILGDMHPETITSAANLAATYYEQGNYTKAEEMEIKVLEQRRQILGDMHPETITSAVNLAETYHRQGNYTKAEEMKIQVLEQRRQILGDMHPDTISSAANLAVIYHEQGNYIKAKEMKIQVLEQRRQLLGDMHPDTISSAANLAATYYEQGNYTKAEEMEIKVLEQRRQLLGDMHPDTITGILHLAMTYYTQGNYTQAAEMHTQVLEYRRRLFGEMHPQTLQIKHHMAHLWLRQSRFEEATKLIEECVLGRREVLGPTHPHTEESKRLLARIKEAHASPT